MNVPESKLATPTTNPISSSVHLLSDGARLHISRQVPVTASGRHQAAVAGLLYFFGGHIDHPGGHLGGYLGQSGDLEGPRAANSMRRWITTQRRILPPCGMAQLRHPDPHRYSDDQRKHVEARVIMTLSADGLWLLNTHTSAGIASNRLTRTEVALGEQLAAEIAHHIHNRIFNGATNPHPSPAANIREAAVRVVLNATRGLDVFDIIRELRRAGIQSQGRTWDYSLRRDLRIRERDTRGRPRVFSTWHDGRCIFWNPNTLTKRQALATYDAAR
jgi:hypothetical protein